MQAIILAAGEGSRMRPLTANQPKVMLPVAGRPLLEHIILRARSAGVDRFVLVVGYGAKSVRSYFGDGSPLGVKIDYVDQDRQLGTGHALMAARKKAEDRFLVLNGDVLPDEPSLMEMARSGTATVSAIEVEDPRRYGVFLTEEDRFKSVVEKSERPPSNLANAGIYLLKRSIFEAMRSAPISERGEYELTDGLNLLAPQEDIRIIILKSWLEIGRPWDILAANEILLRDIQPTISGKVEAGATISGNVSIGKRTIVRSGAYIVGPVLIGEDCDIGPNCYIRPATCIGGRVRIGNAVEVKNSAIGNDSKIGHLSYVGDSIIGERCNFGAGTICSNLRHDRGNIKSFIKGERADSGRRKLGVIMGDDVMTGINTSIYPGTVIASGFRGLPAAIHRGQVLPDK
ncbi:MAG TPA: sugar phosphate nucleotidyltransferase [Methanothrix soehngenii]|jgi:UDP-N-acetylglucosamine diphosphorylase / glucose-1-phosphate thymidylyltransferase / UDP-N-acetylgalactosamine diphosphorylase / glucosamine-1-phosphate N-acetyltransferase / galactosamine-1-phosphate N-acetyltransferase|nr:sugar phosphate nucleotidyltransferase [Methanothrix soehngenii]